ncbi:uncharacterized protein CG16817 [Leptidea sinapis]|uniref:CS domain-containing protein n=1 Tax=Leptidea sinapis TaxID=189913 RepID=A0A5E4PQY2_9NEOP|nr:uncharacterized protein CG16817 [Leptidea sinapis]VVC87445.1 unnamed protein product [Leptidea sinapis]
MASESPVPPPVLWAQRKENIFLTFSVESKDPDIKIEKDSVHFKGISAQDNKKYEVIIPLFDAVVPETSGFVNKGRCIEMLLRKEKEDAPYWPSLTKDKKKPHYLKIDFNKWKDEDDENEEGGGGEEPLDLFQMLSGGSKDNPAKPSFDDLESDSDDENLPDLE